MKHIVVGYDGSESARWAVAEAADMARATEAELHVVNVVAGARPALRSEGADPVTEEVALKATESLLATSDEAGGLAEAVDGVFTHNRILGGSPAGALLDYSSSIDADLIVVGNRRVKGIERLLGSVAIEVVRRAHCSVLVAHTTG